MIQGFFNKLVEVILGVVEARVRGCEDREHCPKVVARSIRCLPFIHDLPQLWACTNGKYHADLSVLDGATTDQLMRLCDSEWNSLADVDQLDEEDVILFRDWGIVPRTLSILAQRVPEVTPWARARLRHADYSARESAARLIAGLAEAGQLNDHVVEIADELTTVALSPPVEDTKEAQAACSAILALRAVGGRPAIEGLRRVLSSSIWDDDENSLEAADALQAIVGESFHDADDKVAAARAWLRSNP